MNISQIQEKLKLIEKRIKDIQEQIYELPTGYLTYQMTGKYVKWFQSENGERKYIARKDKMVAQKLANKKFLMLTLDELKDEKEVLENLIERKRKTDKKEREFINNKAYRTLDILKPEDSWAESDYIKNIKYPDQLKHICVSGICVRSKSEVFIDQVLFLNKILYRYECELKLGSNTFYPDFTIKHPITKKIIYWEHFGMMDNIAYAKKAFEKQFIYAKYGVVQGQNLICTYETSSNPFTVAKAQQMVEQYLM